MSSKRSTLVDGSHLSLLVIGLLLGTLVTAWTQKGKLKSLGARHLQLRGEVERLVVILDEHDGQLGDDEWVTKLRLSKDTIQSMIGEGK